MLKRKIVVKTIDEIVAVTKNNKTQIGNASTLMSNTNGAMKVHEQEAQVNLV